MWPVPDVQTGGQGLKNSSLGVSLGCPREETPFWLRDEAVEGPLSSAAHPLALPSQWGPGEGITSG